MGQQLGQMLLGLVVVIAVLLASLWALKKLTGGRERAKGMRLLGGMALSTRERIVLVQVADKVLVLGLGGAGVRTLHCFDAEHWQTHQHLSASASTSTDEGFSRRLGQAIRERRKQADE